MKAFIASVLLVFVAASVHATNETQQRQERWVCYAQGKQNFGGPIGDIWQTAVGKGYSQYEAISQAHQNCISQGLQNCTISTCAQY